MLTVKEYLENIIEILNSNSDKEYVIKCFEYDIEYGFFSEKTTFVKTDKKREKVIAITTDVFDVQGMFQGFLTYPEEYPDFYSEGNFILCFGPSDHLDFDEVMNREITDMDLYTDFYGFQSFGDLLENNEKYLSSNLNKFNNIITRYRNGEFGEKHLSLAEILEASGEKDLVNQMSVSEIQYLIDNSSGITKMMFLEAKKQKTNSEYKSKGSQHVLAKNGKR